MNTQTQTHYASLSVTKTANRRSYAVTFVKAGQVRARGGGFANWMIPPTTLEMAAALRLLDGRAVFIDHPDSNFFAPGYPSMRDLVGVTYGTFYNPDNQSIDGYIRMYEHTTGKWATDLLDQVVKDQEAGLETPDVGISIVFFGQHVWKEVGDDEVKVTECIDFVESCDLVFGPAAEGRIRQVLSKQSIKPYSNQKGAAVTMPDENRIVPTDVVEQTAAARPVLPHVGGPVTQAAGTGLNSGPEGGAVGEGLSPCLGGGLDTPDLATLSNQVNNLTEWVSSLTTTLAEFMEPRTVRGMGIPPNSLPHPETQIPRLTMWDSYDQVMAAYEQLMGLPVSQPVHRLTGIRELYMLLTGDRALTGRFQPDLALLTANTGFDPAGNVANTTAMAEATRNVMNKVLIDQVDLLAEYRWWERIAHIEDFNSLQQISWVRVGGVGDLPTVAEGGEYTQLAWDDARVTADFTKYGGYLPLTMEMIDKDDVAAWRSVPRQLATAAEVTLSGILSALFTDNSGVGPSITTEGNTAYAFSSTWGNLITQPLDWTNWCLAVETMYELAQLNVSGRAQAVRPRYLLVPIELEAQAITAVTSEQVPGTPNNDRTPTRRRLPEDNVITVPDWTDAENWAAVADPRVCPFVGVGFRFGRNPELFTASDPNTHLMFTNDVLPVKVRWLFAVSVIDPRGAIKSNN